MSIALPQAICYAFEAKASLFYNRGFMTPEQMKSRLEKAYPDGAIEVVDLTGTEDHWQVMIVSSVFKGMSRVQQQRHVMDVFAAELKTGEVHALTIQTKVPAQN